MIVGCAGLLVLAGCAHRNLPRSAPAHLGTATAEETVSRSRLLHIYVDSASAPLAPPPGDAGHAGTIATSLRDLLRERGYDVRATEVTAAQPESGRTPWALARAVTAGEKPPESSRAVTYLHPNSPRLVLFVRLEEPLDAAAPDTSHALAVLGAFIADSADGVILWSNRVTTKQPVTDIRLRLLAAQLLETLPHLPPA